MKFYIKNLLLMKKDCFDYAISKFENGIHRELGQDSFNFLSLKGQGAFGKVYMVRNIFIHINKIRLLAKRLIMFMHLKY